MFSRASIESSRAVPRWVGPVVGAFVSALFVFQAAPLQAETEDQIKAAFLLNFARYVEWPADAFESESDPIQICMLGSNGFDRTVSSTIKGKTVGTRGLRVVSVADPAVAVACHILFLERGSESAEKIVASLGNESVFTVSDDEGFASKGGIANFYRAGNRIRFDINPGAAKVARLKISSRLLRLARLVE